MTEGCDNPPVPNYRHCASCVVTVRVKNGETEESVIEKLEAEKAAAKEKLDQMRGEADQQFLKRIQPLINTWRNGRLKDEDKYRAKFREAAAKFEKKLHDPNWTGMVVEEARQRMEAAIANEGVNRDKPKPRIYKTDPAYLADVKAHEDEFNARRQKEMEEATARCNHTDPKDDDCLICFPVDDQTATTDGHAADEKLEAERIANLDPDSGARNARRTAAIKKIQPSQEQHPAAAALAATVDGADVPKICEPKE